VLSYAEIYSINDVREAAKAIARTPKRTIGTTQNLHISFSGVGAHMQPFQKVTWPEAFWLILSLNHLQMAYLKEGLPDSLVLERGGHPLQPTC
jgi:hypothetical protein